MPGSTITDAMLCPSRRTFLAGAGAFSAWAAMPKFAFAGQGKDPRFLTVILRGAMDGLAVVPPVGDPDYVGLRRDLAVGSPGNGTTFALNDFFGLNEAMPGLYGLYQSGQMPYRSAQPRPPIVTVRISTDRMCSKAHDRSPRLSASGWMNRAAAMIRAGPDRVLPCQRPRRDPDGAADPPR